IMHTTDGGRMWTKQDSGTDLVLRDIRFTNETDGWINAMDDSTGQHVLLRTTDTGATWRRTEAPVPNLRWGLDFVDADNGWLIGGVPGQGIIAHTANGGGSWELLKISRDMDNVDYSRVNAASFVSPSEGWAVGDTAIRHTLDGGATWEIQHVKRAGLG